MLTLKKIYSNLKWKSNTKSDEVGKILTNAYLYPECMNLFHLDVLLNNRCKKSENCIRRGKKKSYRKQSRNIPIYFKEKNIFWNFLMKFFLNIILWQRKKHSSTLSLVPFSVNFGKSWISRNAQKKTENFRYSIKG